MHLSQNNYYLTFTSINESKRIVYDIFKSFCRYIYITINFKYQLHIKILNFIIIIVLYI